MTSTTRGLAASGFLVMLALLRPASADIDTPDIDRRQTAQQLRIEQGIQTGDLTGRESTRLQHQQNRIDQMKDQAQADGVVTERERVRLKDKQNKASRAITRKKRNARRQ